MLGGMVFTQAAALAVREHRARPKTFHGVSQTLTSSIHTHPHLPDATINAPLPRAAFTCSTFRVRVPEYPPLGRPSS